MSKIKNFMNYYRRISSVEKGNFITNTMSVMKFYKLALKKGISSDEYCDFGFSHASDKFIDSFLGDHLQNKLLRLLNSRKYYITARNKYYSHLMLEAHGITNKSELYCYYNPEFGSIDDKRISNDLQSTYNIIKKKGVNTCVIKATESSHGSDVFVVKEIKYLDGDAELLLFDGSKTLLSDVLRKHPLIIESVISQTKQMSDINPSSVNTVRFMTTLSPNGEARVIATFIKIGRAGKCVDNAGSGGNVDAAVDVETGRIYNTIEFNGFQDIKKIEKHPDSNVTIEGMIIDNWESIKNEVVRFQKLMPFVKAAGWDIAITDNGPVIIEVNDYWDRTGQLFIGRGWKKEIEECYNDWYEFYEGNVHDIVRIY